MPIRANDTLRTLRAGGSVLGAETALMYSGVPLVYADAGLDFVWIDLEHTLADRERVASLIQHARLAGITPLVRVPELQPGLIRPLLDNGAQGIVLPLVEGPEDVAELVAWCRFHPRGRRGVGSPLLANDYSDVPLAEHVARADTEILVAVQAESTAAVERIDEIVAVAGLDVVVIGLADLSISCGVPGEVEHPRVLEAAQRVVDAAERKGVAAGVAGFYARSYDEPPLAAWVRRGARFFHLFGDLGLLSDAVHAAAGEARTVLGPGA